MSLQDEIGSAVKWDVPSTDMNDSLKTVIEKMTGNMVSALIVKSGDIVSGVVTDMDIMESVADGNDLNETKVSACMTTCDLITEIAAENPCVQLDKTESVENALGVMDRAGVHNLVVSGDDETYAGTVSARDLLKLAIS